MPGSGTDRQHSYSKIATVVPLTATPSWAKAEHAAFDPTVMKRSISTLGGVIMMRRVLIFIAVLAVPLSLIAGPVVQAASAQGVSTAVVTPASGPAGSTVNGSGSNWTPGDHIQAYWSDDNSTLGSEVVVASDGTFTDPGLKIPTGATPGSQQILFSDVEGRYFEVANFDVTGTAPPPPPACPSAPAVTFSPSSGPLGTTFTISGSGWVPGGKVTSTLPYGSRGWFTGYQTPTVNASGGFSYTETVGTGPGGPTPPGTYTFTYVEKYGGCSPSFGQTFTVTPKPPPASPAPHPTIHWSQTSGRAGTLVIVTGKGWVPGGTVQIQQQEKNLLLGITPWYVDSKGSWKEDFVEQDAPPGTYNLSFSETSGHLKVTGSFTVDDPGSLTDRFFNWVDTCYRGELKSDPQCTDALDEAAHLKLDFTSILSCLTALKEGVKSGIAICIIEDGISVATWVYNTWQSVVARL
jgi:hypothetical protein